MSTNAPAIPLFGDAYLADTHHLTLEEHGAYLKLMMIAWRIEGCALPDDDGRLAQMLGLSRGKWRKLKPVVMAFWTLGEMGWTQGRLTKERAFVESKRQSQRERAQSKWDSPAAPAGNTPRDNARVRSERLAAARQIARHTPAQWTALLEATGNQCVKCHATGVPLAKDHIVPIYQGGSDGIFNLQPLCNSCNSSKGKDTTDYRLSVCNDLHERLPECQPDYEFTSAPPPPPPQVQKDVEAAPQLRATPQPVSDAFDVWNGAASAAGWRTVTKRTGERQAKLRAMLRAEGLEGWTAALAKARASPLLGGHDPPHWFTFDFIVKPGNFAKLIEGNYDRAHSNHANGNGSRNGLFDASVRWARGEPDPHGDERTVAHR